MTKKLFEDKTEGKSQIPFNNGEILVKMAFAVFIVAVTVLLLKKFRKTAVFVTFSVVFAVSCLNIGICVETFRDSHGITHYQQDEAYRLDNYTRNLKGNMLFITDEKFDDNSKIIDTYLSKDYVTATKDDFLSLEDENGVVDLKIKKFTVVSESEEKKYLDFDAFDYVITDSNIEFDENSAEKIDIEGVYFVKVYKLYDKNRICAKINEN